MTSATDANPNLTGKALLLFDGQCPLCRKSVGWLQRLDWRRRIVCQDANNVERLPATEPPLVPQRLLEEMHLLTPDRKRVYRGFGAFRWMAWRLPLLWLAAPLLYLPGVPWLGTRVYRWVARNRYNLVPCADSVCRVPNAQRDHGAE